MLFDNTHIKIEHLLYIDAGRYTRGRKTACHRIFTFTRMYKAFILIKCAYHFNPIFLLFYVEPDSAQKRSIILAYLSYEYRKFGN